jgi:allophanate hydrolase subunit 2
LRVSGAVSGARATIEAQAAGPNAKFPDETAAALRGAIPLAQMTAKAAPAELARRLAAAAGGGLELVETPAGPVLRATLGAELSS